MTTINTDLIEKILFLNDKILKYANENIFNGTPLTPVQFNILGEIIVNNGIGISKLKEKLIISAPALSQILNRMEVSGLIQRELNKTNKREIKIIPTKDAIDLYNKLNKIYISLVDEKLSFIPDEDKATTLALLKNIENIIN
ncbi:MAG: MarR family transcriptional regulator [Candidatus Gracilibacteria bacterium]|nr:MarR family transcriptional regulator [Candidatus Gracilibacteria bacterium]